MNTKKRILLLILICLLIASACFLLFGTTIFRKNNQRIFKNLIMQEDFSDITLTVYYFDPFTHLDSQNSVQELIDMVLQSEDDSLARVITVGPDELLKHKDILKKMVQAELEPVYRQSNLKAHIYLRFDSQKYGTLYDVAMWGDVYSMFVCNQEVQEELVYYKVLAALCPDLDYWAIQRYIEK